MKSLTEIIDGTKQYLSSELARAKKGDIDLKFVASRSAFILGGVAIGSACSLGTAYLLYEDTLRQMHEIYNQVNIGIPILKAFITSEPYKSAVQAYLSHSQEACEAIKAGGTEILKNIQDCTAGHYWKDKYDMVMSSNPQQLLDLSKELIGQKAREFYRSLPIATIGGGLAGICSYSGATELAKSYLPRTANKAA
jgi:hypothetical protein